MRQTLNIEWSATKRLIIVDGETIKLTPIESHLFSLLLQNSMPISYDKLASEIYNCIADHKTLVMLDKHIDRIRGKIRKTAISIHCVRSYGYVLLFDAKVKPQGTLAEAYKNKKDNKHCRSL